jgi:hypothetical protein
MFFDFQRLADIQLSGRKVSSNSNKEIGLTKLFRHTDRWTGKYTLETKLKCSYNKTIMC